MKKVLKRIKFKDAIKALKQQKKRARLKTKTRKSKPRRKIVHRKKIIHKKKIIRKKRIVRKRKVVRRKKIIRRRIVRRKKTTHKKRAIRRKRITRRKAKKIIRRKTTPRKISSKNPLDQLFESQFKVKLLKLFFRNPEEVFQIRGIFKKIRGSTRAIKKELNKLEKIGLIKEKKIERKRNIFINPHFEFFNELKNLVLKPAVISKSDLVSRIKRVGSIKLLVLAGVFIGNEASKADLLIVGDKLNQKKLTNLIKDLEIEAGKELNCAVLTTNEFIYRYDMYDRFVRDLIENRSEVLIKKLNLW